MLYKCLLKLNPCSKRHPFKIRHLYSTKPKVRVGPFLISQSSLVTIKLIITEGIIWKHKTTMSASVPFLAFPLLILRDGVIPSQCFPDTLSFVTGKTQVVFIFHLWGSNCVSGFYTSFIRQPLRYMCKSYFQLIFQNNFHFQYPNPHLPRREGIRVSRCFFNLSSFCLEKDNASLENKSWKCIPVF